MDHGGGLIYSRPDPPHHSRRHLHGIHPTVSPPRTIPGRLHQFEPSPMGPTALALPASSRRRTSPAVLAQTSPLPLLGASKRAAVRRERTRHHTGPTLSHSLHCQLQPASEEKNTAACRPRVNIALMSSCGGGLRLSAAVGTPATPSRMACEISQIATFSTTN